MKLVVLPECWNSPYDTSSFPVYAEAVPAVGTKGSTVDGTASPSTKMMCDEAKKHGVYLVGGSVPEREGELVYNTCVVVNPDGDIIGKHRKVHLFDIDVPGKITFKESDTLTAGKDVTVFDTPFGRVGVGICYDIRFPELTMLMRAEGCDMVVVRISTCARTRVQYKETVLWWRCCHVCTVCVCMMQTIGTVLVRMCGTKDESYRTCVYRRDWHRPLCIRRSSTIASPQQHRHGRPSLSLNALVECCFIMHVPSFF